MKVICVFIAFEDIEIYKMNFQFAVNHWYSFGSFINIVALVGQLYSTYLDVSFWREPHNTFHDTISQG